jgi:hypothetical protein
VSIADRVPAFAGMARSNRRLGQVPAFETCWDTSQPTKLNIEQLIQRAAGFEASPAAQKTTFCNTPLNDTLEGHYK